MAKPRRRRTSGRKRREARRNAALGGGVFLLIILVALWAKIWPYLLAIVVLGGLGAAAWWLWRTDRLHRGAARLWREQDAIQAGLRTLAEVDALTWSEFERYVADLCRRDGCTGVVVSGKSGDLGADVVGVLPDGRRLATCPFSKAALDLAVQHRVLALHRDLLGVWNTGTPLPELLPLNGAGQGDRRHRRRWKQIYGSD